jgi:uncharacterized membrane protein HdeD (DUF308 family)
MNELVGGLGYAVKNWWMSLLLGLLYIAVALCLLFAPVSSYVALSVIFSISILVSGILEVFFAAGNKKTISSWGWYLAGGIIDLLIGIYLVFYPLVSMELIPFIVAFWLMFRGFTLCGYSTDLKRYGTKDWGWYLVFGILAILCYMLSITFLIIGCFRVIFSFELKRLHKNK